MAEKSIFEKIRDREIPADIVHEDDSVVAFRDINPQAPTHVLVIPRQKISGFPELKTADEAAVGKFLRRVAEVAAGLGLESNGYRIVFNSGRDGQQTVDYLHAHILGGRRLEWPPG